MDPLNRNFREGNVIFHEGEIGDCAYIIESGAVEISTRCAGEKLVLAVRRTGEIFGEMAIVDNKPRSASAVAAEDCQLLILSKDQLTKRIDETDEVLRMVLSVVIERFRDTLRAFQSETAGLPPSFRASPSHLAN